MGQERGAGLEVQGLIGHRGELGQRSRGEAEVVVLKRLFLVVE